jgi:diadenosine tetraphosphate (Ap4A) HIT family hydrolase
MELKLVNKIRNRYNANLGQSVPHTHVHIIPQSKEFSMSIQESERKKLY